MLLAARRVSRGFVSLKAGNNLATTVSHKAKPVDAPLPHYRREDHQALLGGTIIPQSSPNGPSCKLGNISRAWDSEAVHESYRMSSGVITIFFL